MALPRKCPSTVLRSLSSLRCFLGSQLCPGNFSFLCFLTSRTVRHVVFPSSGPRGPSICVYFELPQRLHIRSATDFETQTEKSHVGQGRGREIAVALVAEFGCTLESWAGFVEEGSSRLSSYERNLSTQPFFSPPTRNYHENGFYRRRDSSSRGDGQHSRTNSWWYNGQQSAQSKHTHHCQGPDCVSPVNPHRGQF